MSGRIHLFGDNIDTDQLAPGKYMRGGIEELAAHCLEAVRPGFASQVDAGDLIVAGRNFGMGSSREQAVEALKHLGIRGVIARSFAGIFYRNAMNLGLPAVVADDLAAVSEGDAGTLDLETSTLLLGDKDIRIPLEPVPDNLMQLLDAGGLIPLLKRRFGPAGKEAS